MRSTGRQPTEDDRYRRLLELFRDYNSVGSDRRSPTATPIRRPSTRYKRMLDAQGTDRPRRAPRISVGHARADRDGSGTHPQAVANTRSASEDPMLRVIGIKTFLDGGMLTGSAYMREPWGVSKIYAITDPEYRGVLFIPQGTLRADRPDRGRVRAPVHRPLRRRRRGPRAARRLRGGRQERTPVRKTRPCITHSNFMSREAVEKAAQLGVVVDIQPAWLYLDTRTLVSPVRLRPAALLPAAAKPLRSGRDRRRRLRPHAEDRLAPRDQPLQPVPRHVDRHHPPGPLVRGQLHPEEALTREQAIRFYTANNAHLLFREKETGSLEPGNSPTSSSSTPTCSPARKTPSGTPRSSKHG